MTTTSSSHEEDDWISLEEEQRLDDFFNAGQWVVAPGREQEDEYNCYFWENYSEALKFYEENPDVFIYTLLEAEGKGYITKGARYVNREAYLIGLNDVDTGEYNEVRAW